MDEKEKNKTVEAPQASNKWMWPVIVLILILLLLLWWAAMYYGWGPFSSSATPSPSLSATDQSTSSGSNKSGTTTNGTSGTNGTNGTNGSNGTTTTATPTTSPTTSSSSSSSLLTFTAGVNNGDTKESVSGDAAGLNENCIITVNSSSAGKQEVCTYTEGSKIATITYQNDKVVSVSRSGF